MRFESDRAYYYVSPEPVGLGAGELCLTRERLNPGEGGVLAEASDGRKYILTSLRHFRVAREQVKFRAESLALAVSC